MDLCHARGQRLFVIYRLDERVSQVRVAAGARGPRGYRSAFKSYHPKPGPAGGPPQNGVVCAVGAHSGRLGSIDLVVDHPTP